MFNRKERQKTDLEVALERALAELRNHDVGSKEYGEILDRIAKLHKMKEDEKPSSVSLDTQVKVAANLVGILLIISHERIHLVNTAALKFVGKTD